MLLLAALMDNDMGSPVPLKIVSEGQQGKMHQGALARLPRRTIQSGCIFTRDEHITVAHLVRSFHQKAGILPLPCLMHRRISKVRELLHQGMSISEVALSLDFADQAHFTKTFNRFNAMTPGCFSVSISDNTSLL
ncbi:MAG: helix-turn-helix domain-containing protein [Symbiopectobacterium sp.]